MFAPCGAAMPNQPAPAPSSPLPPASGAGTESVDALVAADMAAGETALAQLAFDDAAQCFRHGFELMESLPPMRGGSPAAAAERVSRGHRLCELLLGLGTAELSSGNLRAALTRYVMAAHIARRLRPSAPLAAARRPDETAEEAPAVELDDVLAALGDVEGALRRRAIESLAPEQIRAPITDGHGDAADLARRLGDPVVLARALRTWFESKPPPARSTGRQEARRSLGSTGLRAAMPRRSLRA